MHLPPPTSVPLVTPTALVVAVAKAVPKAAPKPPPPPPTKGFSVPYGSYSNIRVELRGASGPGAAWDERCERLPLVQVEGGGPVPLAGRPPPEAQPPQSHGPP